MANDLNALFCLRWNNFLNNITTELDVLRTDGDFVDVTIVCDNGKIQAHKIILSACSEYFKSIFKENPCSHPVIILKDISFEDMEAILCFVYQGTVYIDKARMESFFKTAESLKIRGLAGAISGKVMNIEDNENYDSDIYDDLKTMEYHETDKEDSQTSNAQTKTEDSELGSEKVSESIDGECNDGHDDTMTSSNDNDLDLSDILVKESPHKDKIEIESQNINSDLIPKKKIKMAAVHLNIPLKLEPSDNSIEISNSSSEHFHSKLNHIPCESPSENITKIIENNSSSNLQSTTSPPPTTTVVSEKKIPSTNIELCTQIRKISEVPSLSVGAIGNDVATGSHLAQWGYCPHCGQKYSNQSALKYHVRLIHSDLTNRLCCYLCPRAFTHRDSYKKHMWERHKLYEKLSKFEDRLGRRPCPLCMKIISNKSNLLKHIRIRHNSDFGDQAMCPQCCKTFKNKYSLRAHINIYHKDETVQNSSNSEQINNEGQQFSYNTMIATMIDTAVTTPNVETTNGNNSQFTSQGINNYFGLNFI